jgi:NAD-dependent SIR2 family protein deacetylase
VQNVDGLDVMAGLPKEKSVAVHGSYTSAQCVACRAVVPIDKFVAELVGKQETPPLCPKPKCRAFLKPSIVMYGRLRLPRWYAYCECHHSQHVRRAIAAAVFRDFAARCGPG